MTLKAFGFSRDKLNGDLIQLRLVVSFVYCIPLAIIQAAAYINRRTSCVPVKTHLDTFRER